MKGRPHKGWKAAARKRHEQPRMSESVQALVYRAAQNFDGKAYPRGTAAMYEQQFGKTRQVIAALRRRFIKLDGGRYVTTVAGLRALGLRK